MLKLFITSFKIDNKKSPLNLTKLVLFFVILYFLNIFYFLSDLISKTSIITSNLHLNTPFKIITC